MSPSIIDADSLDEAERIEGLANPRLDALFPHEMPAVRHDVDLVRSASHPFDLGGPYRHQPAGVGGCPVVVFEVVVLYRDAGVPRQGVVQEGAGDSVVEGVRGVHAGRVVVKLHHAALAVQVDAIPRRAALGSSGLRTSSS